MSWLLILYIFLTGAWGFFAKLSGSILDWKTTMTYIWVPAFFVNAIFVFKDAKPGFTKYHIFAALGGIVASIGTIIFYKLLSINNATKLIPLSGLYVLVTTILCIIFAGEQVNIKNIIGIICAVVAVILLS